MGENFPATIGHAPRVDAADRALAAEAVGDVGDQFGARDRGAVHRDLVGAREQQRARIVGAAHPAADGERHEADFGGAADHVEQRAATLMAGADVEEAQLVGARGVIGARRLDRVARVAQVDEVDALDDAAVGDVEAGDDTDADGHASSLSNPFVSSEVETPRRAAPSQDVSRLRSTRTEVGVSLIPAPPQSPRPSPAVRHTALVR